MKSPAAFRALAAAVGVVVLVALGSVLMNYGDRLDRDESKDAEVRSELAQTTAQLDDQEAKTALLADQLRELGEHPIVSPGVTEPSPSGAPTPAELMLLVRQALEDFCADGRCEGKEGAKGKDGQPGIDGTSPPPITDDQIAAAVAAYCAARDECRGPKGDKGDPGEPAPTPTPDPIIPTPGNGR